MDRFNLRGNQILKDAFDFRSLIVDLVFNDAIEFYMRVMFLRNTAPETSVWYIGDTKTMDAIEELLLLSKSRVFKIKRDYLYQMQMKDKKKKSTTGMDEDPQDEEEIVDDDEDALLLQLENMEDFPENINDEEGSRSLDPNTKK